MQIWYLQVVKTKKVFKEQINQREKSTVDNVEEILREKNYHDHNYQQQQINTTLLRYGNKSRN